MLFCLRELSFACACACMQSLYTCMAKRLHRPFMSHKSVQVARVVAASSWPAHDKLNLFIEAWLEGHLLYRAYISKANV